jgi:phage shock protein PspC (stress-responsive transcriptional regulator)
MNKTVNINLGGLFFYIDEDAYQKMTRYLTAIKRSLNNSNGQDEIIKDIEMRIAELISAKHSSDKQVINMQELDEVIAVMGQPEDYRLDNEGDENSTQKPNYSTNTIGNKKLYRDRDNGMIGGVLAGLGYYFGIDKTWLRIATLALFLFYGFGFLIYIILWIVVPEAVTTSEKIEMRGEPVNLSNIEKQVKEGIDTVSDKIKNADYNKFSSDVGRVGSSFGDVIITLLGIFVKFIGVMIMITGISTLVGLIIGLISFNSVIVFWDIPWKSFMEAGGIGTPIWIVGLLMFFAIGIPFFFLTLLGLKLIAPNTQSLGNTVKYSLLAVCILSTITLFALGTNYAATFSTEGRIIEKKFISYNQNDTLKIKFVHNNFFAKSINQDEFSITEDSLKRKIIYSNNVQIEILDTDNRLPFIEIEKQARGKSLTAAREAAEKIEYKYKIIGNNLIFDNYSITELKNKFRDQEVNIKLYLPRGTLFKADKSVQDYDNSDNSYFNLHFSSDDYLYKVEKNRVKCLDCPSDEQDYDDEDNETIENETDSIGTVSLKVNGKEILKTNGKTTRLEFNKNGIITKTK